MIFDRDWRYGDGSRPPKWLMREFEKALTAMGKNREVCHLFDTNQGDAGFTFIIAIAPKSRSAELAKVICDAVSGQLAPHARN